MDWLYALIVERASARADSSASLEFLWGKNYEKCKLTLVRTKCEVQSRNMPECTNVCLCACGGEIKKEPNECVQRNEGQDGKKKEKKTTVGAKACVGGKDSAMEGKSDWGLKVLRLRVLGLRSEDIIVMFCFH